MPAISGGGALIDRTPAYSAALSEGVVNATTSSAILVNANSNRSELLLVNCSDTDVYIRLSDEDATAAGGLLLSASGGSMNFPYSGAVTAIHGGSGNKAVFVAEF